MNPTKEQVLFIKTILYAIKEEPKLLEFINEPATGKTTALKMLDDMLSEQVKILQKSKPKKLK